MITLKVPVLLISFQLNIEKLIPPEAIPKVWYLVAIWVNLTMTCLGPPVLPNNMIDALTPPGPLNPEISLFQQCSLIFKYGPAYSYFSMLQPKFLTLNEMKFPHLLSHSDLDALW